MNNKALLLFFFIAVLVHAQSYELKEVYKRIEQKLDEDKTYLNLHSYIFQPKQEDLTKLNNIPLFESKEKFNFKIQANVTYSLVFLKDGIEIDSPIVLYVVEINDNALGDTSSFLGQGGTTGPSIDSLVVLRFRDVQELYFSHREIYDELYKLIASRLEEEEPLKLLKIKVDETIQKSVGITKLNNEDFLNFARANYTHPFPVAPDPSKQRGKRRGQQTETVTDYILDASFSNVAFYHPSMSFGQTNISAELSTSSRLLNLLPFSNNLLSLGANIFISMSDDLQKLKDEFLIYLKIGGRFSLKTSSIGNFLPIISAEGQKLNVGSGVTLDMTLSKAFGFPFINFYFATGSENVENPKYKIGPADSSVAYFSFSQMEALMSFFWNTDESEILRLRMDVGLGKYNVVKAVYNRGGVNTNGVYNNFQPVIVTSLNFVPNNKDLFGTSIRLFDSRITFNNWIRVLELDGGHVFRIELSYLTSPIMRPAYDWEDKDPNTFFTIRYRYGF